MKTVLQIVAGALALAFIATLLLLSLDRGNYGVGPLRELHADLVYQSSSGEVTEATGRRVVLLERPDGLFVLPELPKEQPPVGKGKYKLSGDRKFLVPLE